MLARTGTTVVEFAPLDPETVEALGPVERALVEREPNVPWTLPFRTARLGDHWRGTGYLRRLQCRFCLTLDGTTQSTDEGRIGFTSEEQFIDHIERIHQQ